MTITKPEGDDDNEDFDDDGDDDNEDFDDDDDYDESFLDDERESDENKTPASKLTINTKTPSRKRSRKSISSSTDNSTDRESSTVKSTVIKKPQLKQLAFQYPKNKEMLKDISEVDKFLIVNEDDLDANIFEKVTRTFKDNDNSVERVNKNVLLVELQVMEEALFCLLDTDKIKKTSLINHINEILEYICAQCKLSDQAFDKNRVVRRWGFIIIFKLLNSIWKKISTNDSDNIIEDNDTARFKTPPSKAYANIYELLLLILNNEEYFPELRKKSILKCMELNNSHNFRQNQFSSCIENVAGSAEEDNVSSIKCELIIQKRKEKKEQAIQRKKAKKEKDEVSTKKEEIASTSGKQYKQTLVEEFYKVMTINEEETRIEINTKFNGHDCSELLGIFADYFTEGWNSILSSLLGSQDNGSCIVVNNKCIEENNYVLKQLLTIVDDLDSGEISVADGVQSIETILKSDIINLHFIKFTNNIQANMNSIKSDGYCIYRSIFLIFFSYIKYPFDGKTTMEFDTNGIERLNERDSLVSEFGNTTFIKKLNDQDWEGNQTFFIHFWARVCEDIKKNLKVLKDLFEIDMKMDQDDANNNFSFEYLLSIIEGMLGFLKKENQSSNLPKDLWLEVEHIRLIAIVLSSCSWSKNEKYCIPKSGFLFNVFYRLNTSSIDKNIDEDLAKQVLDNRENLTEYCMCGNNNSEFKTCLVLKVSTLRTDLDQVSSLKEKNNHGELKKLMDPSSYIVYSSDHVSPMISNARHNPNNLDTVQSCEIGDMNNNIKKIATSILSKMTKRKSQQAILHSLLLGEINYTNPLSDRSIQNRFIERSKTEENPESQSLCPITSLESKPKIQNMSAGDLVTRYEEIMDALEDINDEIVVVDFTVDGKRKRHGSPVLYDLTAEKLRNLAKQDNSSMISTDTINTINHIINVWSYESNRSSEIFAYDIYNSTIVLSRTDEVIVANMIGLSKEQQIESRLLIAIIVLFPIWFDSHFMFIVLLPTISMAVFLDSFIPSRSIDTDSKRNRIAFANESMRKIILYFNSIHSPRQTTVPVEKWTMYIDGTDADIHPIPQQGPTLNCGVYLCSYMMKVGFHDDINEVVRLFESKEYALLFQDINQSTILTKRKELTVAIVDRV